MQEYSSFISKPPYRFVQVILSGSKHTAFANLPTNILCSVLGKITAHAGRSSLGRDREAARFAVLKWKGGREFALVTICCISPRDTALFLLSPPILLFLLLVCIHSKNLDFCATSWQVLWKANLSWWSHEQEERRQLGSFSLSQTKKSDRPQ